MTLSTGPVPNSTKKKTLGTPVWRQYPLPPHCAVQSFTLVRMGHVTSVCQPCPSVTQHSQEVCTDKELCASVPLRDAGTEQTSQLQRCDQHGQIASASGPSLSRMSSVDTEAGGEQEAAVRLLSLHRRLLTELEGVSLPKTNLGTTSSQQLPVSLCLALPGEVTSWGLTVSSLMWLECDLHLIRTGRSTAR